VERGRKILSKFYSAEVSFYLDMENFPIILVAKAFILKERVLF